MRRQKENWILSAAAKLQQDGIAAGKCNSITIQAQAQY